MLNPLTRDRNYLTIYFAVWGLLGTVQCLVMYFFLNVELINSFYDSIVFNGLYSLMGISFWYMTNFVTFENSPATKIITNHLAAAVVTSALWVTISFMILRSLIESGTYMMFLEKSIVWRFLISILYYFVIAAFNYVIIYYNNFREKVLRETELNALVKEAELTSLKYQINPHFIFNSLNSVSSLTISNPKKAQEMTIKLSEFMRKTLSRNDTQTIKLADELTNVNIYIDIEKVRFDDKFEFHNLLTDDCLNLEVPNMILQPLFENAIKHGVYESLTKVDILLKCDSEKDYYKITVENDFDPEALPRKGEGIGMKNISNRLKLIYKQDNLLKHEIKENRFIVYLYIPKSGIAL